MVDVVVVAILSQQLVTDIIRPHHSTTYLDAAYCYRPSSVVCLSVCHSSETAEMVELTKMPFGWRTWVGPRNHVLDGGSDPPWKWAIFRGIMGVLLKSIATLPELCKNG